MGDKTAVSHFDEYHVGQLLTLQVEPEHQGDLSPASGLIRVRVQRLHTPATLSVPLIVHLFDPDSSDTEKPTRTAFLKLYDRRFSENIREERTLHAHPWAWNEDKERAYINFVQSGEVDKFLRNLHSEDDEETESIRSHTGDESDNDDSDEEEETEEQKTLRWAQDEAFMADMLYNIYKAEAIAYDRMRKYQGFQVPRVLAAAHLRLRVPGEEVDASDNDTELFHVKGLLLEYIDGFTLSNLGQPNTAPRSTWQTIVNEAIACIDVLDEAGILNEDCRCGNFMVARCSDQGQVEHEEDDSRDGDAKNGQDQSQDQQLDQLPITTNRQYRVIMHDFGQCKFEHQYPEKPYYFLKAKKDKEERFSIGLIMRMYLKERDPGYELEFNHDDHYYRYDRLIDEKKREYEEQKQECKEMERESNDPGEGTEVKDEGEKEGSSGGKERKDKDEYNLGSCPWPEQYLMPPLQSNSKRGTKKEDRHVDIARWCRGVPGDEFSIDATTSC